MHLPSIEEADVTGKTILLRVDFNVPLYNGEITDTYRIEKILPTLRYLILKHAKIVLISHLGRPKGKRDPQYSLRPVAAKLYEFLGGVPVFFSDETTGTVAADLVQSLKPGEIAVLENLRYSHDEEINNPQFASSLAQMADLYVNDAFACSHRAHASIDAITQFLPSYAGLLLLDELTKLERYLNKPERPVLAIVGGAKVSTKLELLRNLTRRVDAIAIVGAMANTFFYAKGAQVGKSLYEADMVKACLDIGEIAQQQQVDILLPKDVVVASEIAEAAPHHVTTPLQIDPEAMILDAGPETIAALKELIDRSKTVVWNGALGVTEVPAFAKGSTEVAHHIAGRTRESKIISVAGGGDTVALLEQAGCIGDLTYVSTAGGAFLEWLEGKLLPGIEALRQD